MAAKKHAFRKNGSDLFSRGALERGDRVEAVRENRFSARMICQSKMASADEPAVKSIE
jgi:hypothetical protein